MDWDAIEALKIEAEMHRTIAEHLIKMIRERYGDSEALLLVEQFRGAMDAQLPVGLKDRDSHEQFDRVLDSLSQLLEPRSNL